MVFFPLLDCNANPILSGSSGLVAVAHVRFSCGPVALLCSLTSHPSSAFTLKGRLM